MSTPSPAELLDGLRARGVTIAEAAGKLHVTAPKGLITPAIRDQIATCKPAILDLLKGAACIPRSEPNLGLVCYCCRQQRFWRSTYGVIVCARCHPPAAPDLVAAWIGPEA